MCGGRDLLLWVRQGSASFDVYPHLVGNVSQISKMLTIWSAKRHAKHTRRQIVGPFSKESGKIQTR